MSLDELKNIIQNYVEKSDNKYLLEFILNVFSNSDSFNKKSVKEFWDNLSDEQKERILKSYEQSESENELLDHNTVISNLKNEI